MPSIAKAYGIDDPDNWIIGQPTDVIFRDGTTIVKAQLRCGDTPLAARANVVWDGLTKLDPPVRYYASVGGAVTGREIKIGDDGAKIPVITSTRWNNLALSLNPVHPDLSPASVNPIGTFAKSLNGWVIAKALEASYSTDTATLTGGGALGMQSLDGNPANYFHWRDVLANKMRSGEVGKSPGIRALIDFCKKNFGMSISDATEFVERFCRDLKTGLNKRSKPQ
jgi:hypothetical protein